MNATAAPEPAAPPKGPFSGPREVLLVDDDPLIQVTMGMMLEALEHRVRVASSGEGALRLLANDYRPQVVIMDLNMPGLGGLGTLPRLRELCPEVPIFLATGRENDQTHTFIATHPGVTLLAKPFGIEELQEQLAGVPRSQS